MAASMNLNMSSKRSHSQHSSAPQSPSAPTAKAAAATTTNLKLPAFLRQSRADIDAKFRELNWQEKIRIAHGRSDTTSRWAQDASQEIVKRNRYMGVQPWDQSRIRLHVTKGTSDYINASPISLVETRTGVETRYIATQGPKKNGLSHFWQMIWRETEDVAVIVMLTPTEQSGREKCYQYFPLDTQTSPMKLQFDGDPSCINEGEVLFLEYIPTLGKNTHVRKLSLSFGSNSKTVWHLLFTAFPDFGVPENVARDELLDLISLSSAKSFNSHNPRIVHCSAGVGRSGTFIALEHLLAQLESGAVNEAKDGEDLVYDVVHDLRMQRMMMVQMDNQFHFLYDILRERFEKKFAVIATSGPPLPKNPRADTRNEGESIWEQN